MSFYAFRLDTMTCKNPRGKIPDNDIVTFSVFRNQVECGRGAGFFPDMATPSADFIDNVPAQAVTPDMRSGMSKDWIIGPLEIAPGAVRALERCKCVAEWASHSLLVEQWGTGDTLGLMQQQGILPCPSIALQTRSNARKLGARSGPNIW